jgi:hypothetical protein
LTSGPLANKTDPACENTPDFCVTGPVTALETEKMEQKPSDFDPGML